MRAVVEIPRRCNQRFTRKLGDPSFSEFGIKQPTSRYVVFLLLSLLSHTRGDSSVFTPLPGVFGVKTASFQIKTNTVKP